MLYKRSSASSAARCLPLNQVPAVAVADLQTAQCCIFIFTAGNPKALSGASPQEF